MYYDQRKHINFQLIYADYQHIATGGILINKQELKSVKNKKAYELT